MPWPYQLMRHCMDIQRGVFLNWPYPQRDWEFNQPFLDAMLTVWKAIRHFMTPTEDWTAAHVDYEAWLQEGQTPPVFPLSPLEIWMKQNE